MSKGSEGASEREKEGLGERIAELFNRTWEMEILLFGFVLVFLWKVPGILETWTQLVYIRVQGFLLPDVLGLILQIVRIGVFIAIIGMVFHLVLRGFWIAVVGLNSVYPKGADRERIRGKEPFRSYWEQKVLGLQSFAEKLDDLASANFALTFMLVFGWWSLMAGIVVWVLLGYGFISILSVFSEKGVDPFYAYGFLALISLPFLIYLIDFLSNGRLKTVRFRWFRVPYFYWYRFMNVVTLAFIYRPLYHTFISRGKGKYLPLLIFFLILIAYLSGSTRFHPYSYHDGSEVFHYTDRLEERQLIKSPVIPNKKVEDRRLRVFIPYSMPIITYVRYGERIKVHEDLIRKHCDGVKPFSQHRFDLFERLKGVGGVLRSETDVPEDDPYRTPEGNRQRVLDYMEDIYTIRIDSIPIEDLEFRSHVHQRNDLPGFVTYLPLDRFEEGWHDLYIEFESETMRIPFGAIPFFYVPEDGVENGQLKKKNGPSSAAL